MADTSYREDLNEQIGEADRNMVEQARSERRYRAMGWFPVSSEQAHRNMQSSAERGHGLRRERERLQRNMADIREQKAYDKAGRSGRRSGSKRR